MLQFIANGLCLGAIIAIVGMGFGLIYTTTRVFHLAHASIYVLSGYALWFAMASRKLPLGISILLALTIAAGVGMLIDWAVYQPLARRSASSAIILISSIGVQIIVANAIALVFGNQPQFLRSGVDKTLTIGPVGLSYVQIAQLLAGIALTSAFWLFLRYSRAGQICRAVSDDETLAQVLGVRVARVRLMTFAIGSVFAGVGSILVALDVGMDPHVGFPAVLAAAVACIIGGLRNFLAPAVGGLLLGTIQSLVVWQTSAKWRDAITFALLILFVIFRKQGLFGINRRAEEA
jgi:branched-chain amino acid transport system permease protein